METKINVAEILKDKPKGTKLYSLTYGDCFYQEYTGDFGIECQSQNGVQFNLDEYGKYCIDGECIIFPSKDMREWSKFAWKRGDVLVSNDGKVKVIFDKFRSNTYLSFIGKYHIDSLECNNPYYQQEGEYATGNFKLEEGDAAQTYINTIEERLGGKLNRETLGVEKPQLEFKDGDVLFVRCEDDSFIEIFKYSKKNGDLYDRASLNTRTQVLDISGRYKIHKDEIVEIRIATDSEKQQLFAALEKEGKAWDAEKKQIVELKPKIELKPFDKVLCRNSKDDTWEADFFARLTREKIDYTQSDKYLCVGDLCMYCIPYNEETAHLLGTTDDWEGGE